MRVLGFMTGTSLDAVDMAVLETDGDRIPAFGPAGERKLSEETRDLVQRAISDARAWERGASAPASFKAAATAISRAYFEAGDAFLKQRGMKWSDLDLVGMHGQTVLHERPHGGARGRTAQLGDALWLARQTGVPVAYDFRAADIAANGEGAPLVPIYHMSLARKYRLELPVAALNIGGLSNLTLIRTLEPSDLQAFDTGPGNGMIDQWIDEKTGARFDEDGRAASAGRVNEVALEALLANPYFAEPPPKSLDRYAFSLDPVRKLSVEDGAATLTAFTAEAIALGLKQCAERPRMLIVCGGGRRNPALMREIVARVGVPVKTAEDIGWRGDFVEAEAIALLSARCAHGLPTSFPGTTGVKKPVAGGKILKP